MNGVKIERRQSYPRLLKSTTGLNCTKNNLHVGSILHETFKKVKKKLNFKLIKKNIYWSNVVLKFIALVLKTWSLQKKISEVFIIHYIEQQTRHQL